MSFIHFLLELEGEVIQQDKGTASRLAGELVDAAGGDPEIAKKMAEKFYQQVVGHIETHAKYGAMKQAGGEPVQSRPTPRPAPGYEPESEPRTSGFSRYA